MVSNAKRTWVDRVGRLSIERLAVTDLTVAIDA